jgi:RNA polymerase sigma-70 factor (ECF subfamily)
MRIAAMPEQPDPDRIERMQEAFDKIPRKQREIFLAHRVHGLSYAEIGRRTGLSVRQVQRHMAKALYKLSKQLDGEKLSWWERWF